MISGKQATGPGAGGRPALWSDDEISALNTLWNRGKSAADIAKILGRSEDSVSVKASRLLLSRKRKTEGKLIPCICCTRQFVSEGKHNRMCDPCREGGDGDLDYVVQFGGVR